MAQLLVIPLASFPLLFSLANSSLSSNPSYLLGIPPFMWCNPVHPGPRLLVNWPLPPHSKFPSPQGIPSLIVRLTKTTSRSRLRIVQNNGDQFSMFIWSQLMGPINTGTQSTLILDKTGRIEQGPIVQGPTLTGTCHHSTDLQKKIYDSFKLHL
jgi:hypothetical protein